MTITLNFKRELFFWEGGRAILLEAPILKKKKNLTNDESSRNMHYRNVMALKEEFRGK